MEVLKEKKRLITHFFANLQMFSSEIQGFFMMTERSVRISQRPTRSTLTHTIVQILSYQQMPQMILYGGFVVS